MACWRCWSNTFYAVISDEFSTCVCSSYSQLCCTRDISATFNSLICLSEVKLENYFEFSDVNLVFNFVLSRKLKIAKRSIFLCAIRSDFKINTLPVYIIIWRNEDMVELLCTIYDLKRYVNYILASKMHLVMV